MKKPGLALIWAFLNLRGKDSGPLDQHPRPQRTPATESPVPARVEAPGPTAKLRNPPPPPLHPRYLARRVGEEQPLKTIPVLCNGGPRDKRPGQGGMIEVENSRFL